MPRVDLLGLAAFAVTATFVGGNFVAIRFSNMELDPFWGAALRFVPASAIFFLIMAARGIPFPTGRRLVGPTLFGVFGFGGFFAFVYWGLLEATAATGAIVLASVPLITFFLAWAHRLEAFRWQRLVGGLLVVVGITVLAFSQPAGDGPSSILFVLSLVAAAFCLSEAAVLVKLHPQVHPVATNAIGIGVGAVMLLGLSLLTRETWRLPVQSETWTAVIYLALFGSVVLFFLYVTLIQRWGPSATVYVMVASPLVAVSAGALLAQEAATGTLLVSGILVIAGVYVGILMRTGKPGSTQEEAEPKDLE